MKKNDKIVTRIKDGTISDGFFESIKNADEDDMRVLLAAVMEEARNGFADAEALCTGLGIERAVLDASVKYWRGAGIVGSALRGKSEDKKTSSAGAVGSAHRSGKTESGDTLPSYTTEELAALMEKRKITSEFIDEASRVYGKVFNQHEVAIIVRMIDYIGFDEESVLMLLSFYSKQDRKSLRYVEKAALAFYDEGITDACAVQEKLCAMERSRELEGKIRAMFGMSGRDLTTKEKKYIRSWTEVMKYDMDVIRMAYDITVDRTHEPSAAYANGILERWYADGLDTADKVRQALEKKADAKAAEIGKSFDTDDFFEAALKRSYEK
ncbi:MAG: DnaD domain protein [Eubacteriales bacterium]